MSLSNILVVLLLLIVVGALPTWPHSQNWGYLPSSGLGLVLVVLVVIMVLRRVWGNAGFDLSLGVPEWANLCKAKLLF